MSAERSNLCSVKHSTFIISLLVASLIFLSWTLCIQSEAAEPAAHWRFESNVEDSSGNNNDATNVFGDPVYSPDSVEGDNSISFDGVDDHVELSPRIDNGLLHDPFTQRSVSAWFKAARTDGIHEIFEEGGDVKGLAIRINEDSLELGMQTDNTGPKVISIPFTSKGWTHVAAVFDAGDFTLYVNGEAKGTENLGVNEITSHGSGATIAAARDDDSFDAGSSAIDPVNFFEGLIDDVRVYDTALTAAEVLELSKAIVVKAQGKLVDLWGQIKSRIR